VQINRANDGLGNIVLILRDQAGRNPGENIAGASGRHSRIAGRIHPDLAIRERHHRAMSFENYDELMFLSETAGESDAILLHVCDRQPG